MSCYDFNKKVRKFYKYTNEPNVKINGTPASIENNNAKSFTTANYLTLPVQPVTDKKPWELGLKITTNDTIATQQGIVGVTGNGVLRIQLNSSKFEVNLSTSSSSWNIGAISSQILLPLTTYWFKVEYTGAKYNLYMSTDGLVYNLEASKESTVVFKFPATTLIGRTRDNAWQGVVHLDECYLNIDGERFWSGLDSTKVGYWFDYDNLTICGFSASNYLDYRYYFETPNTFEQVVKIKTGTNTTTAQSITSTSGAGAKQSLGTLQIYNNLLRLYSTQAGSTTNNSLVNGVTSTLTVSANTTYWIKYHFDGVEYKVDVSEDGISYENYISVESSLLVGFNGTVGIGLDTYANNTPFLGSIDLKECYIDINGTRWWNGTKSIEVQKDKEYDYFIELENIHNITTPHLDYYKYTTEVDANYVGQFAVCNNGVASYFQTTDSIDTIESFAPVENDTWEILFKVRTGTDVSAQQQIVGNKSISEAGVEFGISGGKFIWWIGTTTSYNLAKGIKGTYDVLADTDYWVKVDYDGTAITLSYSVDGYDFRQDMQVLADVPIYGAVKSFGCDNYGNANNWKGLIYFNESYININGERWWDMTKPKEYVGNWVVDGVVGTFTTGKYLTLPKPMTPGEQPWEMQLKFNSSSISTTQYMLGGSNKDIEHFQIFLQNSKICLDIGNKGAGWQKSALTGETVLENNVDYWVKVVYTGAEYIAFLSTNGIEFFEYCRYESSIPIGDMTVTRIGVSGGATVACTATKIDMNDSYIKLNGIMWWHGTKATKIITDDKNYIPWTRPNLTANGIMGGASFAVSASSVSDHPAWGAFNGTGNQWESSNSIKPPHWIAFYNPKKLSVSRLDIENGNNSFLKTAIFQGSDDGKKWDNIQQITSNVGNTESWSVDIAEDKGYLYHRLYITEVSNSVYVDINEIGITAKEIVSSSSIEEADYFIARPKFYNFEYKPFDVVTEIFNVSDEIQSYVVPDGVEKLNITCTASRGFEAKAGSGGSVKCDLKVTPGQILYIMVGDSPTTYNEAVYNASDIRIGGTELENRIIVAGGGGTGSGNKGGAGGGLIGGDALGVGYQKGAFGGSQTAGGGASYRSGGTSDGWSAGYAGTLGMGGNGARGSMYGRTVLGGCGGAGYYGGGGGGVHDIHKVGITYAGGGGGSSYTDENFCTNVKHFQGVNKSSGYVKISYIRER